MSEALHIIANQPGERLDVCLARLLPDRSRGYWQKLCDGGFVTTSGTTRADNYRLHENEEITILMPAQPDFSQETLPILYEDDDVLVINKPAGILTHAKGALSDEFTVAEFVRPRTSDGMGTNRPGIVHRLDRGTSGILIAARTPEAKHWLQKQFAQRKVKKAYIALVHGHPAEPKAVMSLPIERNPNKPQTFRIGANGKPAETIYEVLELLPHHTLVKLHPLTGRTHQLRVHMAHLGHPIVGDEFYGKPEKALGRLFLHAMELELTLPSRVRKSFSAPLPPALQQYLDVIR